jgi:hypothetical protein
VDPPAAPPASTKPTAESATLRIAAGMIEPLKDEAGHTWKPSDGFEDGQTKERSGLEIANTKIPSLYQAERFGMTKFGQKIPSGKYLVKLHFAITYEGITGPEQCVMTLDVEGKQVKDLDLWEKAGGANRAYIETVPVTVADGKLDIEFKAKFGTSTLSAIEIVPDP